MFRLSKSTVFKKLSIFNCKFQSESLKQIKNYLLTYSFVEDHYYKRSIYLLL